MNKRIKAALDKGYHPCNRRLYTLELRVVVPDSYNMDEIEFGEALNAYTRMLGYERAQLLEEELLYLPDDYTLPSAARYILRCIHRDRIS